MKNIKKELAGLVLDLLSFLNRFGAGIPMRVMFRLVEIKHGLNKGEITKRTDLLEVGITHIEDDEDARKFIHEEMMKR